MKTLKKFTTQEQFERNCEFNPSIGWNESKGEVSVNFRVWDNRTGYEIVCLTMVNPPERFKDPYFYGTPEWFRIEPKVKTIVYNNYLSNY